MYIKKKEIMKKNENEEKNPPMMIFVD